MPPIRAVQTPHRLHRKSPCSKPTTVPFASYRQGVVDLTPSLQRRPSPSPPITVDRSLVLLSTRRRLLSPLCDETLDRANFLFVVYSENYDFLIDSLSGTDHSWTSSTLKLCAALEKADKLILSANSSTSLLLEKIELLQSILKRGDAAVAKAMEIVQAARDS